MTRDIDSASKFIGAGACTVGIAGSGWFSNCCIVSCRFFSSEKVSTAVLFILTRIR